MEVNVNHINEFEKELAITVDWQDVQDEYSDLLKRYAKIPIKGFRAGKTPQHIIESAFKKEIANDLASFAAIRFCRKALKENNLEAGSPLEINEIKLNKDENFSFNAQFIEMPEFDMPDYFNLHLQAVEHAGKLDEISKKLLENTSISVHKSLINNELKYDDSENRDYSPEQIEAATNRVKLMLILKKIAAQDSIEVSDKDVEERIKLIARENGVPVLELKRFLVANRSMSRLSDSILVEYVLEYIIEIQK